MPDSNLRHHLTRAAFHAERYLGSLPGRRVGAVARPRGALATLDHPLPEVGLTPSEVVDFMAGAVEPGLVATSGPRYFGFVNGGTLPAAMAADWLTSAWDQNAAAAVMSPAAAAVEDVVARWVLDLLDLPRESTVGLVTGCQMAHVTGLAAARHAVLARVGWDVEERGLPGAPPIDVLVGEEAHVTVYTALRLLGLGAGRARVVAADEQGRMDPGALRAALACTTGPAIVCAQAGNVNTGAFDPFDDIAEAARAHRAWLHVDGAFGRWARASPSRSALARGVEVAHSWATDAHKWLNVPYDSGLAIVRDGGSHRGAMSKRAAYLVPAEAGERDNFDFTPEASRRARGFALHAALLSLGRRGVADLVESRCALASRMAERLREAHGFRVLNDVVLNQVLVRLEPPGADGDAATLGLIRRVQEDGTCWAGPTRRRGVTAMRISVCSWMTTAADVDRSADAIVAAARMPGCPQ